MEDVPIRVASLHSAKLQLPPSCIEFDPANPPYFIVGTYSLTVPAAAADDDHDHDDQVDGSVPQEVDGLPTQSRSGSLVVFRVLDIGIFHVQTVLQPSAILDLHFHPSIPQFCGAVSSTGTIIVFDFVPEPSENEPIKNTQILRLPNIREDVLFLSFCWHPNQPDMLALTASTGSVFLVKLEQIDEDWSASSYLVMTHSVEAWTVALAPAVKAVLHDATSPRARSLSTSCFSGGDDSVLKHAVCSTYEGAGPGGAFGVLLSHQPVAIRGHNAGVTAILPLGVQTDLSELIVTGSYDDKIRLWSITPVDVTGGQRRAIMLAEHDLGGGVWRLKRIHLGPVAESAQDMGCAGWTTRLLASCMHAGPKIVQLQQLQTGHYEFRILAEFREHKSMNYGSDFRLISSTRLQCVSTSFYDKLVCLWDWDFSA